MKIGKILGNFLSKKSGKSPNKITKNWMSDGPLGIFIKVDEQVNGINDPIMPK